MIRIPRVIRYKGDPKVDHRPHITTVVRHVGHKVKVFFGVADPLATTYDAVDPSNLPAGGDGYLGYIDGNFASNAAAVAARFPGAPIKTIAVNEFDIAADIFDCEPGNPDGAATARWVVRKAQQGHGRGTAYYGNWQAGYTKVDIQAALSSLGYSPDACDWILADYDGVAVLPPGHVGKQLRGNVPPGFDQSVVDRNWLLGTVPTPPPTPPPPPPAPPREDHMNVSPTFDWNGQTQYFAVVLGHLEHCFAASAGAWDHEDLNGVFKLPANAKVTDFNFRVVRDKKNGTPVALEVTLVADNFGSGFASQAAGSGGWGFNKTV